MAVAEQTLATASELTPEPSAFPPFESATFLSQIFWLVIIFGLLYVLMSRVALPRVGAILDNRRRPHRGRPRRCDEHAGPGHRGRCRL